ncbi:uncharacterized membrane protein (DUF2068 family) [Rhodoblastus acidophilus]|uniref:hypothetical protein n=1 Tax=Rhodoblastus acidophilus TaxID=1074 RepID=UPI002224D3A1|nr:hypothetical protein [Rhodoblastus acidophilus]MCW2284866.1 uncharacterized membrane protein (DUF2068 family) [Rhodoblastus acidophilus]MCW2333844.1 uncharacterized membrane protein (DUF2068 family) [Rhodoblastus acidophilus]
MKTYAPNTSTEADYAAAIQVGAKRDADADQARWTFMLTLFFRVVALLWIAEGLDQWRRILSPAEGFLDASAAVMAAVIFFAVMDLVAAVGLWMVAPWGGVVWLLTLIAQIFVSAMKPGFFTGGGVLMKGVDVVLLTLYLFLSWRVNRANGETGALDRLVDAALARVKGKGKPVPADNEYSR